MPQLIFSLYVPEEHVSTHSACTKLHRERADTSFGQLIQRDDHSSLHDEALLELNKVKSPTLPCSLHMGVSFSLEKKRKNKDVASIHC